MTTCSWCGDGFWKIGFSRNTLVAFAYSHLEKWKLEIGRWGRKKPVSIGHVQAPEGPEEGCSRKRERHVVEGNCRVRVNRRMWTPSGFSVPPPLGNTGRDDAFGSAHADMELSSREPYGCLVDRRTSLELGTGCGLELQATWLRKADKKVKISGDISYVSLPLQGKCVHYMITICKRREFDTYLLHNRKPKAVIYFLKGAYKIVMHLLSHRDTNWEKWINLSLKTCQHFIFIPSK